MFLDTAGEKQGQAGTEGFFRLQAERSLMQGTIAMSAAGRLKDEILNQIPIFGAHQYCF